MPKKPYKTIALGGTFDHFHLGHQYFIDFASSLAQKLLIGITDQSLSKNKPLADLIQPFSVRKKAVLSYCKKNSISCRVTKLTDPYGPTLTDQSIHALCVTEETVNGAIQINTLRKKMHLKDLPVHVCQMLTNEFDQIIHSQTIRSGKINRSGINYIKTIFSKSIPLNQKQRNFFSQIQGEIVKSHSETIGNHNYIVGDSSLRQFIKKKWPFEMGIFDNKEKRKPISKPIVNQKQIDFHLINPPGIITQTLVTGLEISLNKKFKYVFIEGEEDLAVIPLVFMLPLESNIFYGQPNEGLVMIHVSERKKELFFNQFVDQK